LLEVSPATGVRWAQSWRARGSIELGKVGGHMRPLLVGEREWLLARIEQKKDLTLHELLAELRKERGVEVCCDTLWRFMGRLGKTFKRRRSSPRNKTGPTSSVAAPAGVGSSAG
jgi:transposase